MSKWSDEFERGYFHGEHFERERIVNILKTHTLPKCNGDTDESGYCLTCTINLHDAIDIIYKVAE